MSIGSDVEVLGTIDFQLQNMWDLVILDNPTNSNGTVNLNSIIDSVANSAFSYLMKFKVLTCNLPLPGLETESTKTGKKHYTSRQYEGDFSITVMEDTAFSSYSFFNDWMNQVYDFDQNVWKLNPPSRIGMLTYYSTGAPSGTSMNIPTAVFLYDNLKIRKIQDISQNRTDSGPLSLTIDLTFERMASSSIGTTLNLIKSAATGLVQSL